MNNRVIGIMLISMLLIGGVGGYAWGYQKGATDALQYGLRIAKSFVKIEFDEDEIARAMWQYRNNINTYWGDPLQ